MYGADGFASPNNPVPYGSRLYDAGPIGAARAPVDPGGDEGRMPPASAQPGRPGAGAGAGSGAVVIPE